MRTNVLKREEKGIGPVSFARVLMAGLAGVFVILAFGRFLPFWMGCVSGVLVTGLVIFLTQPVSGTPMFQYLTKVVQGMAAIAAVKEESGENVPFYLKIAGSVMTIEPGDGVLDSDDVFAVPEDEQSDDEIADLMFFRDISDLGDQGLQVIDNPFSNS
jgi:hypothetical protein